MSSSPRLFAAVALLLLCFVCGAAADGLSLRDRIKDGLSQAVEGAAKPTKQPVAAPTKRPTLPPTNRPTKAPTTAPTNKATKSPLTTTAPTKKATKSPVTKPTKAPIVVTTKTPVAAPTKKATKVPVVAPTKAPVVKTTKSPVTHTTKSPVAKTTKAPVTSTPKTTKSPVAWPTKKVSPGKTTSAPASSNSATSSPVTLQKALFDANNPTTESPTTETAPRTGGAMPIGSEAPTLAPSEATRAGDVVTEAPKPSDDKTTAPQVSETTTDSPKPSEATTESPKPSEEGTESPRPTDALTESPKASEEVTESPKPSDDATASPSTSDQATETPAVSGQETAAPSGLDQATESPSAVVPLPPVLTNTTTDSPAAEPATNAPSESSNSTATISPSGNASTLSPSAETASTLSPSASPTQFLIEHAADGDAKTASPAATHSPTPTDNNHSVDNGNVTLKTFILSALNDANVPITEVNWTALATEQLYRTKRAGVTSRAIALEVLLALQRACAVSADLNSTTQITLSAASIQATTLPELRDNKRACDELLKMREAEQDRSLREKLEFASASCAMAIRAQEHLYDVSAKVAGAITSNSSLLADYCNSLVTPQLLSSQQYDTSAEAADVTTTSIILASLGLALGLLLLVLHPLPGLWGTIIGFVVSSAYAWGYVAYTAAWYAFNLSDPDAWIASTWWRNYYSTYLLGLAGWLLMMCLCSMLYKVMVRNSWLLGVWSGIAIGIIFGVQLNTIGLWSLAYPNYAPWFTLACCMGGGAVLWLIVLSIASGVSPTQGMIQHLCMVVVGSYLFIKAIGVLVGSYPNEFDMSPPIRWETYVYITCMWVLAIIAYVVHAFAFGIAAPLAAEAPPENGKGARQRSQRSSHSSAMTAGSMDEDKVPLLAPVGSAADSRNQARQQEVTEFGGVRALRPDSENRRLYV